MAPFLSWIATALLATTPQQSAAEPPAQLEITLRTYRVDGSLGSSAEGTIAEKAPNRTWVDLTTCATGVGIDPRSGFLPPSAIVWQSTGRIVEHTGREYVVEISVRRMDATASESAPKTMTLNLGVPVVLDEVSGQGGCGVRSARLEVSVASALETRVGAGGGGRSASGAGRGRAGASDGSSVGSGAVAGGGGTSVSVLSTAAGPGGSAGGAGSVSTLGRPGSALIGRFIYIPPHVDNVLIDRTVGSSSSHRVNLNALGTAAYDAEVWLIQRRQGVEIETLKQTGHVNAEGLVREFPAVIVPSSGGPLNVVVAINLRPMVTADGLMVLRFAFARVVDQGRGLGFSTKTLPMPAADDVLAFELPGMWTRLDEGVEDLLSIQVRITPVKGPH